MQVGDLKYSAHSGDGVGDNEENGAKHKGWGMATSRKTLADIVDLTFGFDPFLRKVIPQTLPRRFAKAFVYTAFVVAFAYLCWYLGYNWFAFFEGICRTKHGTYSIACTQSKDKYQYSDVDHHMVDTIIGDMESAFPNLSFNGLQSGVGGDTIVRMRTRMYTDLINYHPEAVIILWDSDISDPPESDLLTISALSAYRANLVFVLETLKANGVVYIGVGGAGLLGELPTGQNTRDAYLDVYAAINEEVAILYNTTFIPTRTTLQAADAAYGTDGWSSDSGYLTIDGEHLASEGVTVLNALFLSVLQEWYGQN